MNRFKWLKAFMSPFKRPKLYWYVGRIAVGTPYFFPRRWVEYTEKEVLLKAQEKFDTAPKELQNEAHFGKLVKYYTGMRRAVPRKIGFDFVSLGWKTKWNDYRHEWNPIWSFVFFKWQIALIFRPEHDSHYWESWLYYENDTDKTKSKKERIAECREKAPQLWSRYKDNVKETTDYYTKILKSKYL